MRTVFLPLFPQARARTGAHHRELGARTDRRDFLAPVRNRTTGSQNPLRQFGVVKFQNRVFVEQLPQRGSGYTGGKTSG